MQKSIRDRLPRNAGRFLLVGALTTLFDICFGALLCLVLRPGTAYLISFGVCVTVRFWVDNRYTFAQTQGSLFAKYLRYWCSCLLTLLIGWSGFAALIRAGSGYLCAKVISLVPATLSGYALFRWFVFSEQKVCDESHGAGPRSTLPLTSLMHTNSRSAGSLSLSA
ncbi:MAG: GtrA family protein [Verrucomicrobia bacterium]|nr:GtrA family protein [Verrucomicrobiota bacterium]